MFKSISEMTTFILTVSLFWLIALSNSSEASNQNNVQTTPHQSQIIVPTTSGILHGLRQPLNIENGSIYKFLSVPYAQAPVGSLRFKRPVELPEAQSAKRVAANKFGKTCPQYRHLARFISPLLNLDAEHQTSEDCLHLNIYVPSAIMNADGDKLEPTKQLPVIVWIPGEGFDFADARQFDGSYLAHKTQSIVVTVQYRVGVLGFLDAPQFGISGNMGIHDQIMALRWVHKNIGAFGGDNNRTTLMGRFSGSMTISTMITAPNQQLIEMDGEALFNRVILLSGVAVNDWIIEKNQANKVKQIQEAAVVKGFCSQAQINDNSCLQNMPIDQLVALSGYGWKLVVDHELVGQAGPADAIKRNQFHPKIEAVLMGETGAEGMLCLYRHLLNSESNYAKLIDQDRLTIKDLNDIIRDDSMTYFNYNVSESNPMQIALETVIGDVKSEQNLADRQNQPNLREKYLDACSSYMVKSHANRFKRNLLTRNLFVEKSVDKRPVEIYHYELKYKPTFSLAPDYIKTAAHGDDIPLIFGLVYGLPKQHVNEADLLMTQKMLSYIGNFIHGNHPLLQQHQSIDTTTQRTSDNDTTINMDDESTSHAPILAPFSKRALASDHQVYPIDINENEYSDSNAKHHHEQHQNHYSTNDSSEGLNRIVKSLDLRNSKTNLRVIVVESPQLSFSDAESKPAPIIDILEQQHQHQQQQRSHSILGDDPTVQQYDSQVTRSQRLLELHRQQTLEDNSWFHRGLRRNQHIGQTEAQHTQQPQQRGQDLANESSFMTILLLSACILIFALMSFCFVLSLIVLRHNVATNSPAHANHSSNKSTQQFASSSSSCNICEDSQGGSIDAVLAPNTKDNRGFCNMLAKLRNHHSPAQQAQQCPATTATTQTQQHQTQNGRHHHTGTNHGQFNELVLHHQKRPVSHEGPNHLADHQ